MYLETNQFHFTVLLDCWNRLWKIAINTLRVLAIYGEHIHLQQAWRSCIQNSPLDVTVCYRNVWKELFQFHKHSTRIVLKCNLHPVLRRLHWNIHSLSGVHQKMSIFFSCFVFCFFLSHLFCDTVDIISLWYFEQVIYALVFVRRSPTRVVEDLQNGSYAEEVKQPNRRVTCVGPQGTMLLKVDLSFFFFFNSLMLTSWVFRHLG